MTVSAHVSATGIVFAVSGLGLILVVTVSALRDEICGIVFAMTVSVSDLFLAVTATASVFLLRYIPNELLLGNESFSMIPSLPGE